jgi:hypothetical protein
MITKRNDTRLTRPFSEIIGVTAFFFSVIFLSARLGTFNHEFFGHALAAIIVGGHVTSISIDLFATGYCGYMLPQSGLMQKAFVGLAGIAVNFVSGLWAFYMATKWRFSWEWRVTLCLFAIISILSQLVYLVTGAYYDYGDPLIFHELLGSAKWLVWFFALLLLAPCTYFCAQSYLKLQNEWVPSNSKKDRLLTFFSTLAIASLIYAACFWAEGNTTGFLGGMAASEEKITQSAQQAVESRELSEAEKAIQIKSIKRKLRPFPIIVPTLLIVFVSGLKAFWNIGNDPVVRRPHDFKIVYLSWSLFLSILAGSLIIFYCP